MPYSISTSIEIAASPATVREKFLDFSSIPKYSAEGFARSITPDDAEKSPLDLQPGDKIHCVLGFGKMSFSPIITQNTPSEFGWVGSIPYVFTGAHYFRFEEIAPETEGGESRTRFVQGESFTGLLSPLMGESLVANSAGMNKTTKEGFERWNRDFKAWVEN